MGSLASSMNIKQINLMNSSNRRKKDRLTIGESNVRDDLMTSANSKQFQSKNDTYDLSGEQCPRQDECWQGT